MCFSMFSDTSVSPPIALEADNDLEEKGLPQREEILECLLKPRKVAMRTSHGSNLTRSRAQKRILPGTYRYLGQLVPDDCRPENIPVAARTLRDLSTYFGHRAYHVGQRSPKNAVVFSRSKMRFLYVAPTYSDYRRTAKIVFRGSNFDMDIDHVVAKALATRCGFGLVLLARVPKNVNRGHGHYEGKARLGRLSKNVCFADRRILDKLIFRPPKHMPHREDEITEFKPETETCRSVTLKQLGKWAQALGFDEDNRLPHALIPMQRY